MDNKNSTLNNQPQRMPDRPRAPYLNTVLFVTPLLSALMLGMGLMNLVGMGNLIDTLKIAVITIAAFVISYAVYRLAIEKGAPLAARGIKSAAAISLVSILLVGGGLWSGTYPGLALPGVEERRLQEHVAEKSQYVQEQGAIVSAAARSIPLVSSISTDLSQKSECETASSCVSGNGGGGYGRVARILEQLAIRASTISAEANNGLLARDALLSELNRLTSEMQETLADESRSIWDRRTVLRQLDSQIGQTLVRLEEAVPVAMLSAYAEELRAGVSVQGDAASTASINSLLLGYADSLQSALRSLGQEDAVNPAFPTKSGAWETMAYIGQYAPIAILTLAIELIFPLALWGYTLLTLLWERFRDDPDGGVQVTDPTVFEQLTNRPIEPDLKALPKPQSHRNRRTYARKARK